MERRVLEEERESGKEAVGDDEVDCIRVFRVSVGFKVGWDGEDQYRGGVGWNNGSIRIVIQFQDGETSHSK